MESPSSLLCENRIQHSQSLLSPASATTKSKCTQLSTPARMATSVRIFRSNNSTACSRESLRRVSSANEASLSTVSNQRSLELLDSALFDCFQKFAQPIRRNASRATCVDRFHLERIRGRNRYFEAGGIFACESLNNRIRGLTAAGVEDLHIVRIGLLAHTRAAPVKNNRDIHLRPILILSEFLDQRPTRERRTSSVQFAQFGPGENDAVTVNNKIPHRHSIF